MLLPFSQFPNNQAAELSLDVVLTYIHVIKNTMYHCMLLYFRSLVVCFKINLRPQAIMLAMRVYITPLHV